MPLRRLVKPAVIGDETELYRVERIHHAQRHAGGVAPELLLQRDVAEHHRGHPSLFGGHAGPEHHEALHIHRRCDLEAGVGACRPAEGVVRYVGAQVAAVGDLLVGADAAEAGESTEADRGIQVTAVRVAAGDVLEGGRRETGVVDGADESHGIDGVAHVRRQLHASLAERLLVAELEGVRVFGLEQRIALKDVERILTQAERVQLPRIGPRHTLRIAGLELRALVHVERRDRARIEAVVVVVVSTAGSCQIEARAHDFAAQSALQIEATDALAQHGVGGSHGFVVVECIAARGIVDERVERVGELRHVVGVVHLAQRALEAGLQLGAGGQRAGVIRLQRPVERDGVGRVRLHRGTAVLRAGGRRQRQITQSHGIVVA